MLDLWSIVERKRMYQLGVDSIFFYLSPRLEIYLNLPRRNKHCKHSQLIVNWSESQTTILSLNSTIKINSYIQYYKDIMHLD